MNIHIHKKIKNMNSKKNKIIYILIISILIIVIMVLTLTFYKINKHNQKELRKEKIKQEIYKHYNEYVITNKETDIYTLQNSKYIKSGKIGEKQEITLESKVITHNDKYFKIKNFEQEYYIYYQDVDTIKELSIPDTRHKNYIVYNKNIITKAITNFYDENDTLVYSLQSSYNLPIIINKEDKYGVEYNNKLLYVKTDDVISVKENNNTKETNSKGVPVLNYHFVYNPEEEKCNQVICHTINQFENHLTYIKENNIFTTTMNEFEMYIDGEIQLPKSILITIDDGRNVNLATEILDKFKLNATAFIVTSRYNIEEEFIKSNYVELHSHSHDLHDAGTCPEGHGQGGGLTCLSDKEILEDLKKSRDSLNQTTAFCYPFYEYTKHSIELLKKAGFTMAFAGEYSGGYTKAIVGIDKFRIPRWVIVDYTTMEKFINYVNGYV